ncbi:hypothetical protein BH11PSE3_BH11PSE3_03010 [soil metagenome]
MAPADYESEVTFIQGVTAEGTVAATAYATWTGAIPPAYGTGSEAFKWGSPTPGTGATISYFFTVDSDWSDTEMAAWQGGFAMWSAVANVTFVEAEDAETANFVITRGTDGGAHASTPRQSEAGIGDDTILTPDATGSVISIDTNGNGFGPIGPDLQEANGYPLSTVIHEIGHMLGLGHGGAYNANVNEGVQQFSEYDTTLWTLMSYIEPWSQAAKYFDDYTVKGTYWGVPGDAAQPLTPMMLDILAIQRLYGVATSGPLASGGHTFGFHANIEGYIGRFYDFSVNIHPVVTLWSGGTGNTLDLSGFNQDAVINLAPGTFSSAGGLVNNIGIDVHTVIETAIGGGGNDKIYASDVGSKLFGGSGLDQLFCGAGNDITTGGADPDTINPGGGLNILRDSLGNMNGDTVFNFGQSTTIDTTGSLIGRDNLVVTHQAGTTTLTMADSSILLQGSFDGGDFMAVARGSGDSMHTMVTFVPYLPALFENVRVDTYAINGIANQPYLTGDGSVGFTMTFTSAVSAFSNTLGFYQVAADSTLFDAHVIYANTLNPGTATYNLGTPGDGVKFGFFLIQDGFDKFGALPDNLSFVTPGSLTPADLNSGQPVWLESATLGLLNGATVFHSFQSLNPGDALQVLSGVAPGGHDLRIGFEDLPTATGDNDFQDVVVSISSNHDHIFIL